MNLLPPLLDTLSFDRPGADNKALQKSTRLYFTPLEEVGWIDPALVVEHAALVAAKSRPFPSLESIFKQRQSKSRVLPNFENSEDSYEFPIGNIVYILVTEVFGIESFFEPDCKWRRVSTCSSSRLNRFDAHKTMGYSGVPLDRQRVISNANRLSDRSPSRSAIARALSLTSLLGLPARTACDLSQGSFIADTGCGKDMVGRNYFTPALTCMDS